MKRFLVLVLSLVLVAAQYGCAALISGTKQDLAISSNPPGAEVTLDGVPIGQTPIIFPVRRKTEHRIEIRKEGYLEETRITKKGYNWWDAPSFLFPILGIVIDWASGAIHTVQPSEIQVDLLELKEKTV